VVLRVQSLAVGICGLLVKGFEQQFATYVGVAGVRGMLGYGMRSTQHHEFLEIGSRRAPNTFTFCYC